MAEKTARQQVLEAARLHQNGKLAEAEAIYRQVLSREPTNADALHLIGVLAGQRGKNAESMEWIKKAITVKANVAEFHHNLALAEVETGQIEDARRSCERAIQLRGDFAEAHRTLGNLHRQQARFDLAVKHLKEALRLRPNDAPTLLNLARAYAGQGDVAAAMNACDRSLQLDPKRPAAHEFKGSVFRSQEKFEDARECFERAIAIKSDYAKAYAGLGAVLWELGRFDDALRAFEQAAKISPKEPEPRFHRALLLLTLGRYEEGWKEYEARWALHPDQQRNFRQPMWDGSDLSGKTILLHHEQGFGDTIQMVRYAPILASRGARVVVECPKELMPLIEQVKGVAQVALLGGPLPKFDVHVPMMSLPRVMGTTVKTIPGDLPYVTPDPAKVEKWRERVKQQGGKFSVGISWAGRATYINDRVRSCRLSDFSPLAGIANVTIYSLQKGEASAQAKYPPPGIDIIDWTNELIDFSDSAALVANLDLVISVDTAVIHLAGALARRAWVLLPQAADWRWFLHRSDNPWYPTVSVFRQKSRGDWQGLMSAVAEQLKRLSTISSKP